MTHMLPRTKHTLLVLFLLFVLAFASMVLLFHKKADDYAVGEAKKQAMNALLVHRSIHAYVTQVQRPEIYRLKEDQKLYGDYFSPLVMSFTYISRNIKDLLNSQREKHGLEPIYFKLASVNPRNPINLADELEASLLKRMNSQGLEEFEDVVELSGRKYLYLAVPIERSNPGCMKCHGDPADAPRELVAMYGDKAGFYENPNTIRALISIRAPLSGVFADADRMANLLTLVTLLVLSGIFGLIVFFTVRIDAQQRRILQHNSDLSELTVTDALTQTNNRLGLARRLDELVSRAARFRHPMSVLMMDLDHFKLINDRHGHPVGDQVLQRFVAVLGENVRASDIVGRWGGEEFMVLSPHLELKAALLLAEKLRLAVEQATFPDTIEVTVSVGVASLAAGESIDALIERADRALYRAKAQGRNRVVGESEEFPAAS